MFIPPPKEYRLGVYFSVTLVSAVSGFVMRLCNKLRISGLCLLLHCAEKMIAQRSHMVVLYPISYEDSIKPIVAEQIAKSINYSLRFSRPSTSGTLFGSVCAAKAILRVIKCALLRCLAIIEQFTQVLY